MYISSSVVLQIRYNQTCFPAKNILNALHSICFMKRIIYNWTTVCKVPGSKQLLFIDVSFINYCIYRLAFNIVTGIFPFVVVNSWSLSLLTHWLKMWGSLEHSLFLSCFLEIITGSEIRHGIFGVFHLWSRDFFGSCWKPCGFLGVSVFAPTQSSPSLIIRSTPNTPHPSPRMQNSTSSYRLSFCHK